MHNAYFNISFYIRECHYWIFAYMLLLPLIAGAYQRRKSYISLLCLPLQLFKDISILFKESERDAFNLI